MTENDALLARLRAGEAAALGEFWQLKRRELTAYIERRLGAALRRKVEPDDILQETSADAVRGLQNIDLTRHDPFGWLCQLAERRIIDAHRHHFGAQKRAASREVSLGAAAPDTSRAGIIDLLAASMTTASEAFSRGQREARLLAALATLPQEMQQALKLRYVDGLPSKEIARQLGKSDGAVRVLLTRGIGKLRETLGEA